MTSSCKIINGINKDIIIISFSGQGSGMGTIPQFEFVNFLNKYFNEIEKHFYLDVYNKWYHKGIDGISNNIEETLNYLKLQIKPFKKVIFIGSSAGGYASILFGSLLNIDKVIAFKPQTILNKEYYYIDDNNIGLYNNKNGFNYKYINLKNIINNNTLYYIFGDTNILFDEDHLHHIIHCENININSNVILNTDYTVDLKQMRDNGDLLNILKNIIY